MLAVLACAPAWAAALSLPSVQTSPGASVVLPIALSPLPGSAAGLQFDLEYDAGVFTLSAALGDAPKAAVKALYSADIAPGRRRILVIGQNRNAIAGGVLINISVGVSGAAPAGNYKLRISNAIATDPSGAAASLTAGEGSVSVVQTSGPRLDAVLNAASQRPGPVAPGQIVTLTGASISPAVVLFDGVPAPLLYSAPGQINAVVPYAVYGKSVTRLQLLQNSRPVADLQLPVANSSPALFTIGGVGTGPAVILNQGSILNLPSEPAEKGSAITFFINGAGQTDPPGVDGLVPAGVFPRPVLPVSVRIGGEPARVLFAEAMPGTIGTLQISCIVPQAAPSGSAVPIAVSVGNAESPAGVTLAVR